MKLKREETRTIETESQIETSFSLDGTILIKYQTAEYNLMPYRKMLWDILHNLDLEPGMRVLNTGCGIGNFERFVSEKELDIEIEAVDFLEQNIHYANDSYGNLDTIKFQNVAYPSRLEHPDSHFDRVICNNGYHTISEMRSPRFPLSELVRVLKPGGKLIIVTPKEESDSLRNILSNHLRRVKNIKSVNARVFAYIVGVRSAILIRKSLRNLGSLRNRHNNNQQQPSRYKNLLRYSNMKNILEYYDLDVKNILLTNGGESWLACGVKSSPNVRIIERKAAACENENKDKSSFSNKRFLIREATHKDVSKICELEHDVWGSEKAAKASQISSRIEMFPRGNIVAVSDSKIVGYISFILVDYSLLKGSHSTTWYDLTDHGYISTHDIKAKDLFGVNLCVSRAAPRKTSILLIIEVIIRGLRFGVRSYILGSRIPSYWKHKDKLSVEEYVRATSSSGKPIDPELRYYTEAGMNITDIIPNYFEDEESSNYGVIMRKDNPFYKNRITLALARSLALIPFNYSRLVQRVRN